MHDGAGVAARGLEDVPTTREAMSGIARSVEIADVGCPFHNRCRFAISGVCDSEAPPVRGPAPGHRIARHRELHELPARSWSIDPV